VPAGAKVEKLAVNTDLASTFAELAGVEFGEADGRSLAPLLHGEDPPSWRSAILLEGFTREGSSDVAKGKDKGKGKDKAGADDLSAYEAVRTETHKYVEYENGDRELYDLKADPHELDNVYESV
jgi:N-acetylglucosamine-6-sulfatase